MAKKPKIDKKKLQKILEDAIEKRRAALKEYQETPTRKLFDDKVEKIKWHKDSAVMLAVFNPETEEMQFYGIKATPTDIQAMCLYALQQAIQYDPASCMNGISTLTRQAKLNEVYANSLEPENIDDVEKSDGQE